MDISDYIQLLIAIIAGIGAIFAFLNIRTSNKQINLQQKQWEHKHVPEFRVLYSRSNDQGSISLVIENANDVYHQIERILFTSNEVKIESANNGNLRKATRQNGEKIAGPEYHGILVKLSPINDQYHIGILQISGYDALGNEFKANSKELIFKNHKLVNGRELGRTFFKKI